MVTKKITFLLVLIASCYAAIVQSYGGTQFNPLTKYPSKTKIHLQSKLNNDKESLSSLPIAEQEKLYIDDIRKHQDPPRNIDVPLGPQEGLKARDKIISLPGQPKVGFNQYSGYVELNDDKDAVRSFFYYFAECTDKPAEKPLVLWLNGGPGCSSFGAGAMSELGPFRVKSDGKTLKRNQHAWNKKANILFIESPVGVGFSYSQNTSDYLVGDDEKTAVDNFRFLINWLERFPEYKDRDFYIAGESYAGHYVPQLARTILEMEKKAINLKGIAVGNPYVDEYFHYKGVAEYFHSHFLISQELRDEFYEKCKPFQNAQGDNRWENTFDLATRGLDIYDIYAPLCNASSKSKPKTIFDPCTANYVSSYLNIPQVQKALHANTTGLPYPWGDCSDMILGEKWGYYKDPSAIPALDAVLASGIRVWLFNGDTDGACPVTSTKFLIDALGLPVKTKWYAWTNNVKEIGGYAIEYNNLTFVTIRASGHFVPSNQPDRALNMFSSFLEGKIPPAAKLPPA